MAERDSRENRTSSGAKFAFGKSTNQTIIIVSAVIIAVLMLAALIMNVSKLIALNSKERKLRADLAAMQQAIVRQENEISYRESDEYFDRIARELLDMQGKDEITFIAK